MLGTYRFLLANLVVVAHVYRFLGYLSGAYAVFSFYVLSGFLITRISHSVYKNKYPKFVINRFLRIFPMYWVVVILSLVLTFLLKDNQSYFASQLIVPTSTVNWLKNIFLFGQANYFKNGIIAERIVPPAWALSVELLFYLLIPYIFKTPFRTKFFFVVSFFFHLYYLFAYNNFTHRYYSLQVALLPFSLGGLLHFYQDWLTKKLKSLRLFHLIICFVVFLFITQILKFFTETIGFYANLLFTVAFIVKLEPYKQKRFDRLLGDLSYPIYLLHWVVVAFSSSVLLNKVSENNTGPDMWVDLIVLLPVLYMTSYLSVKIVENPVKVLRNKVRVN